MQYAIVAILNSYADAEAAVRDLELAGIVGEQVEVNEGKIEPSHRAVVSPPDLLANQTVPGGTPYYRDLICDLDEFAALLTRRGHRSILAQVGFRASHLQMIM